MEYCFDEDVFEIEKIPILLMSTRPHKAIGNISKEISYINSLPEKH